jgi:hypothetical protein
MALSQFTSKCITYLTLLAQLNFEYFLLLMIFIEQQNMTKLRALLPLVSILANFLITSLYLSLLAWTGYQPSPLPRVCWTKTRISINIRPIPLGPEQEDSIYFDELWNQGSIPI